MRRLRLAAKSTTKTATTVVGSATLALGFGALVAGAFLDIASAPLRSRAR